MKRLIIYNHGKDSTPWGEKTSAFAEVAKRLGYDFQSPDYRGTADPDARVKQLLAMDFTGYDDILLLGSSMGVYVATVAAPVMNVSGLFLLAPAFYLPGYRETEFCPPGRHSMVIHGWQDSIVPPENSWKFCGKHRICLKMLDADHRLLSELPTIVEDFARFLLGLETA